MLKFRNIILKSLCIAEVIILLTGCSEGKSELENQSSVSTTICEGLPTGGKSYSDKGIISFERGIAYFTDFNTNIRMPICAKLNCSHEGRSHTNLDPECDAYLAEGAHCAAIIDNYLYYVIVPDDGDYRTKEFYRSNTDGTDRKLLYRAEEAGVFNYGAYEGGFMVYAYYNDADSMGEKLEKNKMGIYILNLMKEEMTHISIGDEYNGKILVATVDNNKVYYMKNYYKENVNALDYDYLSSTDKISYLESVIVTEVWSYNLETHEKKKIDECGYKKGLYKMGFGYLLSGNDNNSSLSLKELESGNYYEIEGMELSGYGCYLAADGVYFFKNGNLKFWEYKTERIIDLVNLDVKHIVLFYVGQENVICGLEDDSGYRTVCCDKDKIMNGIMEYEEIDL